MKSVSPDSDETLSYDFGVSGHIAIISCEGKIWPGPFVELVKQGIAACANAGARGVLFDIRDCRGTAPSTASRHELGVTISELQSARSPLIVIGLLGREPFIDPGRFGEMVAVQHNAIFRAFTDEDRAVGWLESQVTARLSTESPPLD